MTRLITILPIPQAGWRIVYSLVAISLCVFSLTGCDGHTTVSGRVVDQTNVGISGAEVSLTLNGSAVGVPLKSTDNNGSFFVGGTHAPGHFPLQLDVKKDGFVPFHCDIESNTRSDKTVTLMQNANKSSSGSNSMKAESNNR
ncbi:MAG: carboxypeptidase-like regulatory domain-containing protein [Planctomycetia bacterium]|nr:carboxypeptidase-like regulatory domain-containing protein [Planctomycetia bacterium]